MQVNHLITAPWTWAPSGVLFPQIHLCSGRKTNVGWMSQNLCIYVAVTAPSYKFNAEATGRGCSTYNDDTSWRHVRIQTKGSRIESMVMPN